jgi:4a-hydroxytetrahydrobiopterin dehydratase
MKNDKLALPVTHIKQRLKKLPGWSYKTKEKKIAKEFKFPGFVEAVELINQLKPFCEKLDHHPDIHIYYNKVVFELQRFDIGGKVTERDFTVAKKIEQLYRQTKK